MAGTGKRLLISIHAPLVGRDIERLTAENAALKFQSTRPLWGATAWQRRVSPLENHFNPRAPCGARRELYAQGDTAQNFNPRAPCGARPVHPRAAVFCNQFQSTRPLWGATANLTEFEPQICAWVTKSNRDFRGSAAACSVVLSGCAPRFWQRRCEPAGGGMIAWGSHQMISAPSGA